MARSFHHHLLTAVVALVVGGSAIAQQPTALTEAVTAIRLGKADEAKTTLQQILASDPSNDEAMELYRSVSQDEWLMLITSSDDDIRQTAESILARAKVSPKTLSRDGVAIQKLVDIATAADSLHGDRQAAINKLIADHGEFAVPALIAKLGDADDERGQDLAIYALSRLQRSAVLPLIEVLKSSDELVVRNAASTLKVIGDLRAAPAMAHLANDNRIAVAGIAKGFLRENRVEGNDVDLLLAQGREYLQGNVPTGGHSEVVWSLDGDRLVATDVPAAIYPLELAKSCAADAAAIAPQNDAALALLTEANLAQVNAIEASMGGGNDQIDALEPVIGELRIAADAAGSSAQKRTLVEAMESGKPGLADAAIQLLPEGEGQEELLKALASGDKRVSYEAAAALVRSTDGKDVPNTGRVIEVLANAVTEEAFRTVEVISPDLASRNAVTAANTVRGFAGHCSDLALSGMQNLLLNADIDVVVLNDNLPDRKPEDIIGTMKKDSRMARIKILIVAKDKDAAEERFGESVDGYLEAPLTGETLVAEVNNVLEGVEDPAGERAEGYAQQAANALLALAANDVDIAAAIPNLQQQLDRSDEVSVPAAEALGLAGKAAQLDALIGALRTGSEEVKTAAATAMGRILRGMDSCPKGAYDSLLATIKGDGSFNLRSAAARALGLAKLSAAERAALQKKLRRIAGASNEG